MPTTATEDWSQTREIILTLAPIPSGLASFCASVTIIYMILRSPTKLDKPFRRIIFGMSVYDMAQSFGSFISALPSPAGSRWGAIGNRGTCVAQGFIFQLGTVGSPLYSLSLAFFYLSMIKFNMSNDQFEKKIEIVLHVISNIFIWFSALFLVSTGNFNFTIANCWIGPAPMDCVHNPDVECIHGEHAYIFQWVFAGIPVLISFFGNLIIMIIILWSMVSLSRKMNRLSDWRLSRSSNEDSLGKRFSRRMSSIRSSLPMRRPSALEVAELNSGNHGSLVFQRPGRSSRSTTNRGNMQDDMARQALCYLSANFIIFVFSYVYRIIDQVNGNPPFVIILLARVTNPLQGLFNILIYTRMSVAKHRANSNHSWIRSFWIVVQSGVDHDERRRRARNSVVVTHAFVNGTPRSERGSRNNENKLKSSTSRPKGVKFQDDCLLNMTNTSCKNHNNVNDLFDFTSSQKSIEQDLAYVDNVDDDEDDFYILKSNLNESGDIETVHLDENDGDIQMCSRDDMTFPIPLNIGEGVDPARIKMNDPVEAADNIEYILNTSLSNENFLALESLMTSKDSPLFKKIPDEEDM